jgi:hypothetical protein
MCPVTRVAGGGEQNEWNKKSAAGDVFKHRKAIRAEQLAQRAIVRRNAASLYKWAPMRLALAVLPRLAVIP